MGDHTENDCLPCSKDEMEKIFEIDRFFVALFAIEGEFMKSQIKLAAAAADRRDRERRATRTRKRIAEQPRADVAVEGEHDRPGAGNRSGNVPGTVKTGVRRNDGMPRSSCSPYLSCSDDDDAQTKDLWFPDAVPNWREILTNLRRLQVPVTVDCEVPVPETVFNRLPKKGPRLLPHGYLGQNVLESDAYRQHRQKLLAGGGGGDGVMRRDVTQKVFPGCPTWCSQMYEDSRRERVPLGRLDPERDAEEISTVEYLCEWLQRRVTYRNRLMQAIIRIDEHFRRVLGLP